MGGCLSIGGGRPGAFTGPGVGAIFVVGGLDLGERILRHEYRHLEQGGDIHTASIYLALVTSALAICFVCSYAAPHLCKYGGVYTLATLAASISAVSVV